MLLLPVGDHNINGLGALSTRLLKCAHVSMLSNSSGRPSTLVGGTVKYESYLACKFPALDGVRSTALTTKEARANS